MSRKKLPIEQKQSLRIGFAVTQNEYDFLSQKAKYRHENLAQYARNILLNSSEKIEVEKANLSIQINKFEQAKQAFETEISKLNLIGNNLNQIARFMNTEKKLTPEMSEEITKIKAELIVVMNVILSKY